MFSDSAIYVVLAFAIANLALIGWVLHLVKSGSGGASGLAKGLDGRFDTIEHDNEGLRGALIEMDRELRREILTGAGELRQRVIEKLAEAETRAADGRFALVRDTTDAIMRAREAIDSSLRTFGEQQGERLLQTEQAVRDLADRVRSGFDGFLERLREQQEQLRDKVESKLEEMRIGNEAKLEQMRKAVDEQLQSALEKGLEESFRNVTEKFAAVQQAIGQVQSVAGQIGDLKRLFSNVKARGGVGEDQLQAILDDVLPAGSYETNFRIGDEGAEVVEYAVRMPRRGPSDDMWLAIDAKFPTEDYDRLLLASESGDRDQEMASRKALERRIRDEGKRIKSKYIKPPRTMEIAIMFLPNEGLYSEVYRIPGLIETLRRQYGITVMGPGLLPAFLHCIRVSHDTLVLEEKAGAIREILSAVKAEWGNLGNSLDMLARRAETLRNGIKDTQMRTRVVGRTLKTVPAVDFEQARKVLGLSEETMVIEADVEDEIPVLLPSPGTAHDDSEQRDAAE
jgi:DNA recombination protein RmuC